MVDTDNTQRMTDDRRWTTPRVWHKLPTGGLKKSDVRKSENEYFDKKSLYKEGNVVCLQLFN